MSETVKDRSGGDTSAGPAEVWQGSGGKPFDCPDARHTGRIHLGTAQLPPVSSRGERGEGRLHPKTEDPAAAAATWVVDAGASCDVVPTEAAEAKTWQRVPLREPLAINTANGRIESTHAAASREPGMPEKAYAAEMPNTPMLISVGRRCLKHGYSFVWIAGRRP